MLHACVSNAEPSRSDLSIVGHHDLWGGIVRCRRAVSERDRCDLKISKTAVTIRHCFTDAVSAHEVSINRE